MAGAGFKTFNTGDVLTASDVNTYLMQQTVMVFADASARSTALGANVAEGMISYLKDTNTTAYYDGSSWVTLSTGGDITEVTAGAGLSGGGTSGAVTLNLNSLSAGRNGVINGGFDIWQRGTSISVAASTGNAYTADRWGVATGANVATTVSRQSVSDTTNLPNIQYCGRFQRNSGQTGTAVMYVSNAFETVNSIPFVGKTVALSFYARAGANFSAASSILVSKLYSGTGTDQQSNTGYTGVATVASANNTLTTTWQRFTITGTVATTANELSVEFSFTPVGTAGAADYFEITGVQLELGSSATPFSRAGGSIQGELAACERYFQIVTGAMCSGSNTTTVYSGLNFRTQMRTAPTVALSAAMVITDAGADYTQSSANISIQSSRANSTGAQIVMANFSSITTHRPYSTTITGSQIQLSAEL